MLTVAQKLHVILFLAVINTTIFLVSKYKDTLTQGEGLGHLYASSGWFSFFEETKTFINLETINRFSIAVYKHGYTVCDSTVQYSTVQYSTVQYSTVQYSTVQYSTVQYSTVQYSTVQYLRH